MDALILTRQRTDALSVAMDKMHRTTSEAVRCCDFLTKRARQLDSLTSPASDASSMLSRANANLAATLVLMRDAREKFDTVTDCEPAIDRLHSGVMSLIESRKTTKDPVSSAVSVSSRKMLKNRIVLTEQDVYAAADSMEILRDAYAYFVERRSWRSAPSTLLSLERLYGAGSEAMCLLVAAHLKKAGQAVRPKRIMHHKNSKDMGGMTGPGQAAMPPHVGKVSLSDENAHQTRDRLAAALQNRDLLKCIGEFEEYQPVEARPVREIRSIFDCLGSQGYALGPISKREHPGLSRIFGIPAQKVNRTEKVGSGRYTNILSQESLKTGFPQIDAYGEARKEIAYASIDNYYRKIRQDRKKKLDKGKVSDATKASLMVDEADAAARDAVRCLEHAMVVCAGEKSVYRAVVSSSLQKKDDDEEDEVEVSPYFRKACVGSYSFIAGSVVDRTLDVIEMVFFKEGGLGQVSGSKGDQSMLTVRQGASAAAAGLRMLDGVRMLGPSLAKLCEIQVGDGMTDANSSIAATLCIAIHRTTVKNAARTLENLAKAIQDDPLTGPLHRPKDASVSTVTSDVVHAIRLVSPFVSAYKSVSKRRALPWDPNMGDEAGELESFIRFLVMRLINSLKGKALNYTKEGRDDSQAKSNLFLMNNAFYLLEELGPSTEQPQSDDPDKYRLEGGWFVDKINKLMESEKAKYLGHWEALNTHLTAVASGDLEYQKNDSNVLSHESGRLIKQRFSGFNEDFERTYALHQKLCTVDPRLRITLQQDVTSVFLPRYRRFYEKYTKIKFSKKHQDDYTKYSPDKLEDMLSNLYVDPENTVPAW